MELGGKWPVSIVAMPDVAAGARLWRTAGAHRLTIVVKATFSPVHQAPMQLAPPEPIVVDDTHVEGDEARSVLAASDLAPYLPRGEVSFVGRAHAEGGVPVPALSVRLAVYGQKPLVEKTLHVVGPRTLGESGAGAPEPFTELPIAYERALRGAMDENPAGLVPAPAGPMPTVLDPDDAAGPAGLGPIASRWPGRRRLLRQLDPALLDAAVPELPDAFAWSYFHAAPADQRCTFFAGDEWIVLDHLWRGHARLESRLPGARASARIYDGGAHVEVPLVADTLFIDGHREVCSLVWRGNVAVDPQRLGAMEVLAGIALPGRPIPWPGEPASPPAAAQTGVSGSYQAVHPAAAQATAAAQTGVSGSYQAVHPGAQTGAAAQTGASGSYHAVHPGAAPTPSAPAPAPAADARSSEARSPSSPPTPSPRMRNPSGSFPAAGEPGRAMTPSYGMRYPTPTPGSHPAVRSPTPPPFSPPPAPRGPEPVEDDGGHTVMRPVDARLLEQLAADGPSTVGRIQVPAAPGAHEERAESTALFSMAHDTTLMKIARGEAPSPASQGFGAPVPSEAQTARRPTAEHELVDEQTFVHDDAELARLLEVSAASTRDVRASASPIAEEAAPPTMAAPSAAPLPDAVARRAMRATSRGLGPVHVLEASAVAAATGASLDAAGPSTAEMVASAPGPDAIADGPVDGARPSQPFGLEATRPGHESLQKALREELLRRLASGQPLTEAHLDRADLTDLDLSHQSLAGALLRGARLDRSRLDGADLTGARLEGASLAGVTLTGARLTGANLDGANLDGASLLSAQLDDASLAGASLVGAVVVDASATRAIFREAELRDARFDRSTLTGADFERAKLTNASFLATQLEGASFFEAVGTSASFVEATLTGARFDQSHCAMARFARAVASDTLWNEAVLDGASFEAASLAGATFAKASCQGAVFSSAELAEARFQRARLDGAIFTGADVEGAVFDDPGGPPTGPTSGSTGGTTSG